jgi:tetratricopeptide (TPR) repeat protein
MDSLAERRRRVKADAASAPAWLELALALDSRGREREAVPAYERALRLGLEPADRRTALISLASSQRNLGQTTEALRTIERARREFREDPAVEGFAALILLDAGRPERALRVAGLALVREADPEAFGGFGEALARKFRGLAGRRAEGR